MEKKLTSEMVCVCVCVRACMCLYLKGQLYRYISSPLGAFKSLYFNVFEEVFNIDF